MASPFKIIEKDVIKNKAFITKAFVLILLYQIVIETVRLISLSKQSLLHLDSDVVLNMSLIVTLFFSLILFHKKKKAGWILMNSYILLNLFVFLSFFLLPLISSVIIKLTTAGNSFINIVFVETSLIVFPMDLTHIVLSIVASVALVFLMILLNNKNIKEIFQVTRIDLIIGTEIAVLLVLLPLLYANTY